jgi:hypothetical protein
MREIGQDVSEVLDSEPGSFHVVRHIRPKLACGGCRCIVQARAPSRPIQRGLAGAGLLSHVLASKYADHMPLYRQSQIFAREGVDLQRSTLADWVRQAAQLLTPVALMLRIRRTPDESYGTSMSASTAAASKRTTTSPSGRCAAYLSAGKFICTWALTAAVTAPQRSTRSLAAPSSTASNRSAICTTC